MLGNGVDARAVGIPPGPDTPYRGNYASLPALTLKPPPEGNRTVPVAILWQLDGQPPSYTIHFNARAQQVVSVSQICALHVDNTQCGATINIVFPDTQFQLQLGPNSEGFYPVVTNSLEFYAYIDVAPGPNDRSIIQVLNFLPPPIEFGTGLGSSVGTVRQIDTVAPIQGGPITDQGSISIATPIGINFGGTGAITRNVALDNLSGASGATAGGLTRSSGGIWSVTAVGVGTITQVVAGNGMVGGGSSGSVTLSLVAPVSIANGGTGAIDAPTARTNLGVAPLNSPAFTGTPSLVSNPPLSDNTQAVVTASWVKSQNYGAGNGTVTGVTAGSGLSGGGTSGVVTLSLTTPAVAKGGDTMTGPLTIQPIADSQLVLRKAASGQYSYISGYMAANLRWNILLGDNAAESSGNQGSNFVIQRFADNGTGIDSALSINRATGDATFSRSVIVGNGITGGNVFGMTASGNGRVTYLNGAGTYMTYDVASTDWAYYVNSINRLFIRGSDALVQASAGPVAGNGAYINIASFAEQKSEIRSIPDATTLVKGLKPVAYTYDPTGEAAHGFIIEDLITAYPETVKYHPETGEPEGYRESMIVAGLTAALQEALARIEQLEAKTAGLT